MTQFDINTEYEQIFGISNYPTLYESEDEEYKQLRQQIIETAMPSYSFSSLPFEGIYNIRENDCLDTSSDDIESIPQITYNDHLSCYHVVAGIRNYTVNLLMGILSCLSGKLTHNLSVEIKTQVNRHIFWITIFGRCKAYGYLDKESKNFYIGTDSLISTEDNNEYIATSSCRNRHRLIKNYGIPTNNYIKLKKDVKCRSAVAAARYVVGATVDLDLWKDASGRTLYDIYPEIFFR